MIEFTETLRMMKDIHESKNADYSTEDNPLQNFDVSSILVSFFKNPKDQVFASIIGIKLGRLAVLLSGKTPNNESINDTFIDLANYVILWKCYRGRK